MSPGKRRFRLLRGRRAAELDEEIRVHLEMRADDLVRKGWSPAEAEAEARRRFGSLERARSDLARSARRRDRRLRLASLLDSVRDDLRLALRQVRRTPGFSLVALVTLGLGIGLTTAAFTVVDRVLLRPLPFERPDRLVTLLSVSEEGFAFPRVASENWLDWEAGNRTLEGSAIFDTRPRPIVELEGGPVRASGAAVSPGFFEVLRPPVRTGRTFGAAEVERGDPVVVVAESFWRGRMGASPLPTDLVVAGERRQVVGVVPPEAAYPAGTEIWLPETVRTFGFPEARNLINWEAVGRLRAGVAPEQAEADLSGIADGIRERSPEGRYSWGVGVLPLHAFLVREAEDRLLLLLAAVAAVLVIACLNLAGLSLARTLRRLDEIGVRVALGAGRWRIARQVWTEHLLLGLAGSGLGIVVAAGLLAVVERRALLSLPRAPVLEPDLRTLAWALAVALLSGLLAGSIPAVRAAATEPARLERGLRSRHAAGRNRSATALVVGEVALALALLVGAGLLLRSFRAVVSRDVGFDPRGVLVAEVPLDRPEYAFAFAGPPDHPGGIRRRVFWDQVQGRLRDVPGVEAVGIASSLPTVDGGNGFIEVEGRADPDAGAGYQAVGGDYFRALGIPLRAGRLFDERDGPGTPRVTVIDEAMAARHWPETDPVGRRVRAVSMEGFGRREAPWLTVVGVVGDVRQDGYLDEPRGGLYVLAEQVPYWMEAMHLVVDAGGAVPPSLREAVEEAVRRADPSLPVETGLLEDRVGRWVAERLLVAWLLTGFGVLAAFLSAIGLYGMLAFLVAGRTREIGIRAALGATRGELLGDIVRRSLGVALAGIATGLVAAYWTASAMESQLVDVGPADPWSYGVAAGVLLLAAAAAAVVPAWRASRVDPVAALRSE